MTGDCSLYGEVLKVVFPLLDGDDLTSCMLVSHQWRNIASDEFFWKCLCIKRWPSISKRPTPNLSYRDVYQTFSKSPPSPLPIRPILWFDELEYYIDLWSGQQLIFSEVICGSKAKLWTTDRPRPQGVPAGILENIMRGCHHKISLLDERSFSLNLSRNVAVSVLVARKDNNKMACILSRSNLSFGDTCFKATAYGSLNHLLAHPVMSVIWARVSVLFLKSNNEDTVDVFDIVIDFDEAGRSMMEFILLLDALDWK